MGGLEGYEVSAPRGENFNCENHPQNVEEGTQAELTFLKAIYGNIDL